MADVLDAKRPPAYGEVLDMYRAGVVALAQAEACPELSPDRAEGFARAGALFAGAQAGAALRLIAPVNVAAGGR